MGVAFSQPSRARRKTLVRTSRSFTPNGASRSISPASITAPPWGAIASPQTVMISEGARGGEEASSRRIHRRICGLGGAAERGLARIDRRRATGAT